MIAHRCRILLALACCLFLTACAAKRPQPPADPGRVWNAYLARQAELARQPADFILRASFWYSTPDRSNRTIVSLWGNLDHPLRADLNASMGAAIGLFREDAGGWTAYHPQSKEAEVSEGEGAATGVLGVSVPFTLRDVGLLLSGRLLPLTGDSFGSSRPLEDGQTAFILTNGRFAQRLVLDEEGRPVGLAGGDGEPWSVVIKDYDELAPGLATVVEMTLSRKRAARLIIKSMELRPSPWPASALSLDIPPDVVVKPARP